MITRKLIFYILLKVRSTERDVLNIKLRSRMKSRMIFLLKEMPFHPLYPFDIFTVAYFRNVFSEYSIDAVQWCIAHTGCTRFAYIHADSKTNQSCVPSGHRVGTSCSSMRWYIGAILRNALSETRATML